MTSLPRIGIALSGALFTSASFAAPIQACAPVAKQAALAAVAKTPALGQETVHGTPYASSRGVLRIEVDVFATPSLVYDVDVTLDGACDVLGTHITLENNPWTSPR